MSEQQSPIRQTSEVVFLRGTWFIEDRTTQRNVYMLRKIWAKNDSQKPFAGSRKMMFWSIIWKLIARAWNSISLHLKSQNWQIEDRFRNRPHSLCFKTGIVKLPQWTSFFDTGFSIVMKNESTLSSAVGFPRKLLSRIESCLVILLKIIT